MEKEPTIFVEDQFKKKRQLILRAFLISLFGILLLCAGFIGFLQFTTFENYQTKENLQTYLSGDLNLTSQDGMIELELPTAVISEEMTMYFKRAFVDTPYELSSLYYNPATDYVEVNLTLAGFYIPIYLDIQPIIENQEVVLHYNAFGFTNKQIEAKGFFKSLINWIAPMDLIQDLRLDMNRYPLKQGLVLREIDSNVTGFKVTLGLDEAYMEQLLTTYQAGIDPSVYEIFMNSVSDNHEAIETLAGQVYPLDEDQVAVLVEDALTDRVLLKEMLMLMDEEALADLADTLKASGVTLDTKNILLGQKAFVGKEKDAIIMDLFDALSTHFEDKMLAFNQGKPFDLTIMRTLTVDVLANMYDVIIDSEDMARLSFVYDNGFKVAYRVDEDAYYIRGLEHYEVVDKATYESMMGSTPFIRPTYVTNGDLWKSVTDYIRTYHNSEGVWVRYMKSDGESVFAVISLYENPQDYWPMALSISEDGTLTVLDENVKKITSFIQEFPDFNAETIPLEIETVSLKEIDEEIHQLILDELYYQRIISSKKDVSIVYSSYNGKYIAFKLSTGSEYVYKVEGTTYGTYLSTVYTKDKAVRNWRDLPELLTLQDDPTEQ